MFSVKTFTILIISSCWTLASLMAQGTLADFKRAEAADSLFKDLVYSNPSSFHWLNDNRKLWYVKQTKEGKEFILADLENKVKSNAFDQARLADSLAKKIGKPIKATDLPFDKIEFTDDQKTITFTIDSAKWQLSLSDFSCELMEILKEENGRKYWGDFFDEKGNEPVISPDSLWTAFIRDSNVFIKNGGTGKEYQLSYDGSTGEFYSSYMKWSPDSKKLMAYKVRPGENRRIFFVESSPEGQLQPKLCYRDYRKPGDVLPQKKPQLFLINEKKHVPIEDELFRNQYDLSDIEWRTDSRSFTFEFNQRGHQLYRLIEVEAPSGKIDVMVEERSETFIDYSSKKYRYDVNDGKEIIWASERDGWNHLYLYDGNTGEVKNQITKGHWVVREVIHVNDETRQIIFAASGLDKDEDPYLVHYCKVNFDGSGFKRLTHENANHSATFSDNYLYFADRYSRIDMPPVTVIRRSSDGKAIMTLEEANIAELKAVGWKAPEVFTAKGRDGKTDIWGMIVRPSNFDASKKYPIVEYIYAGPHSSYVPKSFHPYLWSMHGLAELGFILVQIDGMGTSNRSKAFHDVCWKNLKDAGFPDRIAWIKAAAEKYPYMDTSRVGIHGVSAGGQSAAGALIFHPEFYRVAVSSCGSHDNRMDKIWWNEQWMGYPVGPHYAESSNVVNAGKLQGKLMLILGEMDDNVDPASTMQLADALIKSNKDFEFVVIPGMGHSTGGEYGQRKRRDFFVRHLLDVEPPSWKIIYKEKETEKIN